MVNKIQNTGLKQNKLDKFYTSTSIVEECIENIKKYIQIETDNLIIEPSAGNGAFINKIKELTNNYNFYDIEPENNEIMKRDFLILDTSDLINRFNKIHVIGNPPFGRQSSLAIKFIKKCCQFANTISFILPKSFKKNSMKKYFSLNYHLIFD